MDNNICVLCNDEHADADFGYGFGNNAGPLADGKCCDECDKDYVTPARALLLQKGVNTVYRDRFTSNLVYSKGDKVFVKKC